MSLSEEQIMQQLMSTFKDEAEEHLEVINKQLLELEKNPSGETQELLQEVFREAHSLKGAARAVEATAVETCAHSIESMFAAAKRGELSLGPAEFDLLYEGLDFMTTALSAAVEGTPAPDQIGLQRRLSSVLAKCATDQNSARVPAPEAKQAPIEPKPSQGPGPETTPAPKKGGSAEETVRVSTRKLDALMTHVEELLVSKIRTEQRVAELKSLRNSLQEWQKTWQKKRSAYDKLRREPREDNREIITFLGENQENLKYFWSHTNSLLQEFSKDSMRMSLITEELQEDIRRARMLPVASVFESFKRTVRDLARQQGKQVNLVICGTETELDKKLIEGIKDPLMHIIRNSVDHGIETPEIRVAAGKPAAGTIQLSASQQGNGIKIEVEDDGAGIDCEKIRAKAQAKGMISAQEARSLSDDDARLMIFQSGFSTATKVTSVSGRGVGLDVVKTNIEKLNGLVTVTASPGGGTRISLSLPLTLSTSRVLLIEVSGETFAVPTTSVERIVRANAEDIFTVGDKNVIQIEGRSISLVGVSDVLELPAKLKKGGSSKLPVIVLGAAEKRVAFVVDSLVGEMEIVIKSLGKMLSRVRNVSGATVLGSGQVVMILNVADMIKSARGVSYRSAASDRTATEAGTKKSVAVLVVDDSITTRIMEKNILESAGYRVTMAQDGVEALETLKQQHFDLIVSDVDMPRMNGFELTTRVKESDELQELPVVLVTSLDSAADKAQGLECGADAYIVKHSFDQRDLLDTIKQLV